MRPTVSRMGFIVYGYEKEWDMYFIYLHADVVVEKKISMDQEGSVRGRLPFRVHVHRLGRWQSNPTSIEAMSRTDIVN
jgi:hypothetical protein